eukprot:NODE_1045_length_2479_cov_0.170588.p2 type:complete len:314 gc:universal NODE_1045_length_2479_cov_0.170588:2321-1380(-)
MYNYCTMVCLLHITPSYMLSFFVVLVIAIPTFNKPTGKIPTSSLPESVRDLLPGTKDGTQVVTFENSRFYARVHHEINPDADSLVNEANDVLRGPYYKLFRKRLDVDHKVPIITEQELFRLPLSVLKNCLNSYIELINKFIPSNFWDSKGTIRFKKLLLKVTFSKSLISSNIYWSRAQLVGKSLTFENQIPQVDEEDIDNLPLDLHHSIVYDLVGCETYLYQYYDEKDKAEAFIFYLLNVNKSFNRKLTSAMNNMLRPIFEQVKQKGGLAHMRKNVLKGIYSEIEVFYSKYPAKSLEVNDKLLKQLEIIKKYI